MIEPTRGIVRRCLSAVGLVASSFAVSSVALAAEPAASVGVHPIAVEGEVPPHTLREINARLRRGLGPDAKVVDRQRACVDASCWAALAARTNVDHLVDAAISARSRDYRVKGVLIHATTGEVVATVTRECDVCGLEELATTVEDLGDALRRRLDATQARPSLLAITSTPAGAAVELDGTHLGLTPLTVDVQPGEHVIEIGKARHFMQRRRVAFVEGVTQEWQVDLVAAPDERRTRMRRALGWTAIGVGIGATGVGVGLALLDNDPIRSRCSGDDVDLEGDCKYRYKTLAGGVAMAVVGAGVLVTGITLLSLERRSRRERRVAVLPTLLGIQLSGRF